MTSRDGESLKQYYAPYIDIAKRRQTGIILDTPTWRASCGWGEQLGYSVLDMQYFNEASVDFLANLREHEASYETPMVINGVIGPQDDGYNPVTLMSETQAEEYHRLQVATFAQTNADMVTAVTMTYAEEAIGITRAAVKSDIPVVISFTVETDGRLPNGQTLQQAIEQTDRATESAPAYYMINCAHPTHFDHVINGDEAWMSRIYGIRANASCMSHAELDEATELDDGNPEEFGQSYRELNKKLKNLRVVGGCCGTDHRHIDEVCLSLLPEGTTAKVA